MATRQEMDTAGAEHAAMVLLHRELSLHKEVRLTKADFDSLRDTNDAVHFDRDESTGDIVLTHVPARYDA